jgi:hypothetical protein
MIMNYFRKQHKAAMSLVTVLSASAVFLIGGFYNVVLCVGENGHIAVENTSEECCSITTHADPSVLESNVTTKMNSCGNCVDVPLHGSSLIL